MNAFGDRAQRELLATGEGMRSRTTDAREDMTAQEAQIARLAWEGLSNRESGVQLFLSHRTVEWHMRKVFTKLGISSRRQLVATLEASMGNLQPDELDKNASAGHSMPAMS